MLSPRPVLIVDDDADLRATLSEQLSIGDEFQVTEAGTAGEAETLLIDPDDRYDAVLLDIGLPDGNGRDLCMKLRKLGVTIPIIMLTGADADIDIVRGLDAGANDYICKPFRRQELLARLRAQLRGFDSSDDAVLIIGPYSFRPSTRLLSASSRNQKIRLTAKEAAILKFLHRANGRSVLRQVLLDEVWGYSAEATTHTLESHIYRLRAKVELDPKMPRLLLSEAGGYRLNL